MLGDAADAQMQSAVVTLPDSRLERVNCRQLKSFDALPRPRVREVPEPDRNLATVSLRVARRG